MVFVAVMLFTVNDKEPGGERGNKRGTELVYILLHTLHGAGISGD